MKVRLLLSAQRSGSHLLKSIIESRFPDIACTGKVLDAPNSSQPFPALASHPEFPHFWPWYEREAVCGAISVTPDRRLSAFEIYLSKLAVLAEPKDLIVDTKYDSIRSLSGYRDTDHGSHDFTSFVTSRKIPVLHLMRKNLLRVVISHKLAQHTGIWLRTTDLPEYERLPQIRLNPKGVLSEIRYAFKLTQEYQNRFSGYAGYHEVVYEDFLREQRQHESGLQLQALNLFLDKSPAGANQPEVAFKKTTPDDLSAVVENWLEVIRVIRTTEHGWMTDAPYRIAA
jgi:LPS sulfotransferase NodH